MEKKREMRDSTEFCELHIWRGVEGGKIFQIQIQNVPW